jgi:phage terminase large subunit-like protein
MPRTLVRAPAHDRTRSLGWLALAWIEYFVVHGPGDVQGEPVRHGDEYSGFIVDSYALSEAGRRIYDAVFLSRPKGCDKSGQGGRFSLFEALGPCRFAGWAKGGEVYEDPWGLGFRYVYESGEPMGRPVKVPFIRIIATEEDQTGNVYDTVFFNLSDAGAPLSKVPGVNAGLTRILLPGGGEITPSTASSASKDGGKETFVDFDETHLYITPELRRTYRTVIRNLRKRKKIAETWYLETTTMFAPGEDSVAETTYEQAEAIADGRARGRARTLFDHQWGEVGDVTDEVALRAGLIEAYGDALEWNDLDGLVDEFYQLIAKESDSRRYFLNARASAADGWMKFDPWNDCGDESLAIQAGDTITLGFDGAVRNDSTALAICRLSDGFVDLLDIGPWVSCWEKPIGPEGDEWQVDREAVDAAVAMAFEKFNVVGFYADPPFWQDYIDKWNAQYGDQLIAKATQVRPIEWWTNRPTIMERALERFRDAVFNKDLKHRKQKTLTRHVLNARERTKRAALTIGKEHPKSPRKIDAAMAAVLAYEARADAIALGAGQETTYAAYTFNT